MTSGQYVVGDIHGRLAYLRAALDWIDADGGADAPVVFVGDLVDRGPESRAVIEMLMSLQMSGRQMTVLKGNHDRLFVQFWQDRSLNDGVLRPDLTWLHPRMGGGDTLASYGVAVDAMSSIEDIHRATRDAVPADHIDWLASRALSCETSTHFFCHAGIRPGVALVDQAEEDLLWIRGEFHDAQGPHPKIIVHGHTPVEQPINYRHRINVDGGAGAGRPIHPVVIEEGHVWMLSDRGRVAL